MALPQSEEPWVPKDTFGARLALIRQRLRMNVKTIAELCEVNHQSWRNWEDDETTPRRYLEVCDRIAAKTGCDALWLKAGVNPMSRWITDFDLLETDELEPTQGTLAFGERHLQPV